MNYFLKMGSLLLLLTVPQSLIATEITAEIIKPTPLKSKPETKSKTLINLKSSESVNIKKRQGGWYQLDSSKNITGWVKMLSIRFNRKPYRPGQSGLGASLSSLRTGHSGITATTGVRGLNEESLVNAGADFKQLAEMEALAVDLKNAKSFAKKVGLKSNVINYWEKK